MLLLWPLTEDKMAAQRDPVTCSKPSLLWRIQDWDVGTRIHVIKYLQCCLHNHQYTHTASKLDSLLLFLMPYCLFYTHSSQSGLSNHAPTFTSFLEGFHITLEWNPNPYESCLSLSLSLPSRSNHIALLSVLELTKLQPFSPPAMVPPAHTDLVKRWGQRLNGEQE